MDARDTTTRLMVLLALETITRRFSALLKHNHQDSGTQPHKEQKKWNTITNRTIFCRRPLNRP